MAVWGMVLFVIAAGFTTAGLLSAIHRMASGQDEWDEWIDLSFASPLAVAWSILMCTFAGPYLAVSLAWPSWRRGDLANSLMLLLGSLSVFWSFCSGVVVVQTAIVVGSFA